MRVAVAADHRGYPLKEELKIFLQEAGHEIIDLGAHNTERSDYPDFARAIGKAIQKGEAARGVLMCGSGVGASIAANKVKGVRAALCHDIYSAGQGVEHDDMNVLCVGAMVVGMALVQKLVEAFLAAEFIGEGRYLSRLEKVIAMEDEMGKE